MTARSQGPLSRDLPRSLCWVALVMATVSTHGEPPAEETLPEILGRLERVAALYRDQALRFTCDEGVHLIRADKSGFARRYRYVYVRGEDGRLEDYRTLRKGDGERIDMTRSDLPAYVLRAYSSVLLFERDQQSLYRYELLERDEVRKRPALRIAFEPRAQEPSDPNLWHGSVWIDADTYQLLRFEGMEHGDVARQRRFEHAADTWHPEVGKAPEPVTVARVTTEFGIEKNGMRFPSKVTTVSLYLSSRRGSTESRPRYQVVQRYKAYRFYGVRTSEQIEQIVFAD